MTVLAIAILAVWAVGIAVMAALFPHVLHSDPMARHAFDVNPVAACLATAIAIAFWPAALGAAGLNKLADRRKP